MTVCGSWCYVTVIRDATGWEDFPDDGSECAVARPWHTCFLRFELPGNDYSSTACIESDAASRGCTVRGGEPGSGLFVSVALTGHVEPRVETCRRAVLEATRASNGSPPRPQAGQDGKATLVIQTDHASKEIQEVGEDESYVLEVTTAGAKLTRANAARRDARAPDLSSTGGGFPRRICRASGHNS